MLARFERLMEQAVEGSLRRVFPTSLQPVQLAKAAARAMEDSQVIGLSGIEVPNSYRLYLAPADLERFSDYSTTLARELSRYLLGYARERGLRPVGEPRIELLEDAHQRRGRVRAEARFVDLPPARKSEVDAAVQGTRQLRLADLASAGRDVGGAVDASASGMRGLTLTDALGLRFGLDVQAGVVRMGRAPDNDVTIDNQRVSRYHAQLRLVESSWLVYDLDSTNGTFVDQQRVLSSQPQVLRPGSTLRLGDHDLSVAEASQD
jgi:hypothetical protein